MEVTIFVCPACGYWRGERDGLYAKAGRCPRCVKRRRIGAEMVTLLDDVSKAPQLQPHALTSTQNPK